MTARVAPFLATALLLGAAAHAADASWVGAALPSPSPAPAAGDRFGATLAIGEDLIAVGAYLADRNGKDSGAVYLYQRQDGGSWKPPEMILEGRAGDQLGFDLAIDSDGKRLLVGAPFARNVHGVRCGAVRKYKLEGSSIVPDGELEPPECEEGAEFGSAVAVERCATTVEGPVVCRIEAVGARGAGRRAGRIYASVGGKTLRALEADVGEGAELGTSLATDGEWLVAGAPFADVPGTDDAGAVYAFDFRAGDETPRGFRASSGRARGAAFGYAVALRGNRLAVGAPLEDDPAPDAGAVHLFSKGDWGILPGARGDGEGDQFGAALSWGKYLFVGARRAGDRGEVYRVDGAQKTPVTLDGVESPPHGDAEFGFGVATREALLAVGAFMENGTGAAYVFEQEQEPEEQEALVSLVTTSTCVVEGEGRVPLMVQLETTDGKPLETAVELNLELCPPDTGCTATSTDFRPRGTDLRPLGGNPQTIPVHTEVGEYTLAWVDILSDSTLEGPETLTVRLSPAQADPPGEPLIFSIEINDSRLILPAGPVRTREQGLPVPIQIELACQPAATVDVALVTTDATEGTVSRRRLELTTEDWEKPVDLNPVDDPFCDGPQTFAVEVRTRSQDRNYSNLFQSLLVDNEDDELACLSAANSVCAYADNTVVYTIELANGGPETVTSRLEDPLPSELSVVTASADGGVATVDYLENSVVWNGAAPAPGDRVTITIVAALDPQPAGTDVANQATLTWIRDSSGSIATASSDDPATSEPGDATVFDALEVFCPP